MFIFLERDSFEANSRVRGEEVRSWQSFDAETAPIRRPYRGIQIKDDTYAVLSVRKPDGRPVPLASSSSGRGGYGQGLGEVTEYSDFILQQVNDQRMEKQQIIETFGDAFVYFFGERPRMVTFQGQLINTEDFNWRAQFWHNYEHYFRGSRLVQLNARCYLAYDTIVIEGYPLSATAVDDADNPYQVSFQMTMLMTDYHEYSTIGETRFPVGPGATNLEVLNQELEEKRKGFVSTTVEVRRANLYGSTSKQLPGSGSALAVLRASITQENTRTSWLGDRLATINNLSGGRAMRIPIGAASFLQLAKEGEIASASVTTSSLVEFDSETGERFGTITVNGQTIPGNKLLIMGPSRYAPMWTSKSGSGMPAGRGFIHENYDEYPLVKNSSLKSLLTESQYKAVITAEEARHSKMTSFQESLYLYNIFAAQGGVNGTSAAASSAVRDGYGMLATAGTERRDPTVFLGGSPENIRNVGEGQKSGGFLSGVSAFIGGEARQTWEELMGGLPGGLGGAAIRRLGDVFDESGYQSKIAGDQDSKDYEAAYGNKDYTPLVQTNEATKATLDEVYGDTDSSTSGVDREDPSSLEEVYGQEGMISQTVPPAEERAKISEGAYNGDAPVPDTDTSGITAEDDDGAPIDPVV